MGWDVSLKINHEPVKVPEFCFGSIVKANESLEPINNNEANMVVTYNYSNVYAIIHLHLRHFDGVLARDTIDLLKYGVNKLGVKTWDRDYYAPTPGNAGFALSLMLSWAELYPDAVWEIL